MRIVYTIGQFCQVYPIIILRRCRMRVIIQQYLHHREFEMISPTFDSCVTFLYTRDLAKTIHFYEHLVGLSLVLDQGSCRIYQVMAGAHVGFCQRDDLPEQPGAESRVIITLVTRQVDGWYEKLKEQGVLFEKSPVLNAEYHIYHCFLRDPNGYLIEIQQFLDPRWPG
jgi:catechol 2,3-dioxygenase-like lactoylglutathione lyase family enzyme